MILDTKDQQLFLLELLSKGQYPGTLVDFVHEIKKALEAAEIKVDGD